MKASCSKLARRKSVPDAFETAVVTELRHLRTCERVLQRMYPRLKSMPQLRERFMLQLAEMQQRAERLDVVLNPIEVLQLAPRASRTLTTNVA